MTRAFLSVCAFGVAVLLPFASAQAPKDGKAAAKEMWVVLKADLFEIDDVSYQALLKTPWRSLQEIDRELLEPTKDKKTKATTLFDALAKQTPLVQGKEIAIDPRKKGKLIAVEKVTFLHLLVPNHSTRQVPVGGEGFQKKMSTESARRESIGGFGPPLAEETLSLSARVLISDDRRAVRAEFTEKSVALEGLTSEIVRVGDKDKSIQTPYFQKATITRTRDIPDGSAQFLALTHRPYEVRQKGHWLVARVRPRIVIEAEEKALREAGGK